MGRDRDFQSQLDKFIGWMEKSGMLGRWERQREIDEVRRNLRRLNKKIREERIILECLNS